MTDRGHDNICSACRQPWTCYCLPGETDPATCVFVTTMDDDCAMDYLEACDRAEDTGAAVVTMTVTDVNHQQVTITYRDGAELERHLAGSAT